MSHCLSLAQLGCFCLFAVPSDAAVDKGVGISICDVVFNSCGYISRSRIAGHTLFKLWRNPKLFYIVAEPVV